MNSAAVGVTLALDASTYEGSVAVLRDGVLVAERAVAMRGETEERLMPAAIDALREAGATVGDVRRVVCGEGPGSFTSLRIAGSIAKGIAFGNAVPLFAASSLALIVAGARSLSPGRYLAVLDAMRGERYTRAVTVTTSGSFELAPDIVRIAAADVATVAAQLQATPVGPLEAIAEAPHARGAARLLDAILRAGPVALDGWEPTYGRLAEAQVKWEAAHGRALDG